MITEDKKREYVRRLILSRIRLLNDNGFFGLLLMHAQFALDIEIETAATDGEKIFFSPDFMDELSDSELDFVLMHEIMHVALRHCIRTGDRDPFLFNIACDIVVNSNILLSNNNDRKSITIKKYGESMHLAPDNKEGYEYTVEEVYEMLLKKYPNAVGKGNQENAEGQTGGANGN
ncbi:MAG: M48 family metalloprotease, partial [Clostridia bacterium]|nr:M48 family metalloprotease [Clostridia bacterium]